MAVVDGFNVLSEERCAECAVHDKEVNGSQGSRCTDSRYYSMRVAESDTGRGTRWDPPCHQSARVSLTRHEPART